MSFIVAIAVARQAPNLRDSVIAAPPEIARDHVIITSSDVDIDAHNAMVQAGQCINATHHVDCATCKCGKLVVKECFNSCFIALFSLPWDNQVLDYLPMHIGAMHPTAWLQRQYADRLYHQYEHLYSCISCHSLPPT